MGHGICGYLSPKDNGCRRYADCFTCPFEDCMAVTTDEAVLERYYQKKRAKAAARARERRRFKGKPVKVLA